MWCADPTATAALDALEIPALQGPATAMLAAGAVEPAPDLHGSADRAVHLGWGRFRSWAGLGGISRAGGVGPSTRLFQWIGLPEYGKAANGRGQRRMRSPSELVGVGGFSWPSAVVLLHRRLECAAPPGPHRCVQSACCWCSARSWPGWVVSAIGLLPGQSGQSSGRRFVGSSGPISHQSPGWPIIGFRRRMAPAADRRGADDPSRFAFGLLFGTRSLVAGGRGLYALGGKEVAS